MKKDSAPDIDNFFIEHKPLIRYHAKNFNKTLNKIQNTGVNKNVNLDLQTGIV